MPSLTTDPRIAAAALRVGHLAALPTETVYGLAADATRPEAIRRCFAVKGRPATHPVIVHIRAGDLDDWAEGRSSLASVLTAAFWPGPLTVVVRKQAWVSSEITGGQATVALRCVDHPAFAAVLAELAPLITQTTVAGVVRPVGLAAPSANRFGRVSPTTARHVLSGLAPHLDVDDVILDGGTCSVGVESTIVDCTRDELRVLRPGAIGIADIRRAVAAADLDPRLVRDEVVSELGGPPGRASDAPVRVPGALHSHYAPRALVRVVAVRDLADRVRSLSGSLPAPDPVLDQSGPAVDPTGVVGLIAPAQVHTPPRVARIGAPADVREFAHGLYSWMRQADELGCAELFVVLPGGADGLSGAIADRVRRAAVRDHEPQ